MFLGASIFNGDISSWDTGGVPSMSAMFKGAYIFNRDIPSCDTAVVTSMSYMFNGASKLNIKVFFLEYNCCNRHVLHVL